MISDGAATLSAISLVATRFPACNNAAAKKERERNHSSLVLGLHSSPLGELSHLERCGLIIISHTKCVFCLNEKAG